MKIVIMILLMVGVFGCEDDNSISSYKCGNDSIYRVTQDGSTNTYEFGFNNCNTITSFTTRDKVYLLDNPEELDLITATKTVRGGGYINDDVEIRYFNDSLQFQVNSKIYGNGQQLIFIYRYVYGDDFITKQNTVLGNIDYIYDFDLLYDYILEDVAYDVVFLEATQSANLL